MFFMKSKAQKNQERFKFYITEIINKANAQFSTPDCTPYLQGGIDRFVQNSKSSFEKWDANTNVERYAYTALFNVAFDVLRSGKMHIYRGVLNETLPCDKLFFIVDEALKYAVKNGEITEAMAREQKHILRDDIACVG